MDQRKNFSTGDSYASFLQCAPQDSGNPEAALTAGLRESRGGLTLGLLYAALLSASFHDNLLFYKRFTLRGPVLGQKGFGCR